MKHAFAAALALALPWALPAPAFAQAQTQTQAPLTQAEIRSAVEELAAMMEQSYVFPDVARQYSAHLRTRAAAGAYDLLTDPALFAQTLQAELRGVHQDAHLRVTLVDGETPQGPRRGPPRDRPEPLGADAWLAPGVAYLQINNLLGGQDWAARTAAVLDQYADAETLILDLRQCPGGGLHMMDPLFARLYAEPTRVMIMDTRTGANPGLDAMLTSLASIRSANGPQGVSRYEHWAQPLAPAHGLADARVFVLTGRTGSACEHLAQALRETGRATLVGSRTGGAGHYGSDRVFGGGRFQVFLPVGVSYAPNAQSWETVGVLPHREVAPDEALNDVLRELNVPLSAANAVAAPAAGPRVVANGAPPTRRYGIMIEPPIGAQPFIVVQNIDADGLAARAGLRAGDRILSLNGRAVSEIPAAEIGGAMRASPLTIVIERNGVRQTIQMSLDS